LTIAVRRKTGRSTMDRELNQEALPVILFAAIGLASLLIDEAADWSQIAMIPGAVAGMAGASLQPASSCAPSVSSRVAVW
jgi:hypothetical protein